MSARVATTEKGKLTTRKRNKVNLEGTAREQREHSRLVLKRLTEAASFSKIYD
jgi:hypothetical protein